MGTKIVDAGLDYLTLTWTPRMQGLKDFDSAAHSWFVDAEQIGLSVKDASQGGYNGWKVGGTFYGRREDSCIWKSEGNISNEIARYIEETGLRPNVTRVDWQVTHESGEVADDWAAKKIAASEIKAASLGHSTKQSIGYFKTRGRDTGATLGKRGNQAYYRTYLAGVRHKGKYSLDAIRDECEFKDQRAKLLFAEHQIAKDKIAFTRAVVRTQMERYHAYEPWHEEAELTDFPPIKYEASDERSMLWIENYVCPVIARLAQGPYRERLINVLQFALKYEPQVQKERDFLEPG